MIDIFIPIHPRPQERPRHRVIQAKAGKRAYTTTYDPSTSRDYKRAIAAHAKDRDVTPYPAGIALKLVITFYLERPKSVKRQYPTVKPDLDNYIKAVKDALKGIAWHDDGQVCSVTAHKEYALPGASSGVWIGIRDIKQ